MLNYTLHYIHFQGHILRRNKHICMRMSTQLNSQQHKMKTLKHLSPQESYRHALVASSLQQNRRDMGCIQKCMPQARDEKHGQGLPESGVSSTHSSGCWECVHVCKYMLRAKHQLCILLHINYTLMNVGGRPLVHPNHPELK